MLLHSLRWARQSLQNSMLCLVSNYPNYLSPPINKMLEGQIRSLDVGPHIATHGVTPGCSDSDLLGQHPSLFPEFSHLPSSLRFLILNFFSVKEKFKLEDDPSVKCLFCKYEVLSSSPQYPSVGSGSLQFQNWGVKDRRIVGLLSCQSNRISEVQDQGEMLSQR